MRHFVLCAALVASACVAAEAQTVKAGGGAASPPDAPARKVADAPPASSTHAPARADEKSRDVREAAGDAGGGADDVSSQKGSEELRTRREGFHWSRAVRESMLFLAVQHGYALTQPKTRRDLHGPFFKDYFSSVKSLHGWDDGGRFFTNYVAHPMQGSLMGFVQIQNDPAGSRQRFGRSRAYWRSRLKALAWSAAWSTQFEIGPLSQASIGNVGLHGKQTYEDLIVTPTVGTGLLVVEDFLDLHVVERIERATDNRALRIAARMILNPTRSAANVLRFKKPWHRDAALR